MFSELTITLLFHLIVFIYFGAVLGSFSSAVLYRVQQKKSWIKSEKGGAARSACPNCRQQLKVRDLIPLVSWLLQKGKCRYCKEAISAIYPLLECFSIGLALLIYTVVGFSVTAIFFMAALPFVLAQIIFFYRSKELSFSLCAIILVCVGFAFSV